MSKAKLSKDEQSKAQQNKTKHNTRSLKLNVTSWFLYS